MERVKGIMFSGIIESLGQVKRIKDSGSGQDLLIKFPSSWRKISLGESIAVNGVCLTVTRFQKGEALFYCQQETLESSSLGSLSKGSIVNLERALKLGSRISGHLVQGHVDYCVQVLRVEEFDGSWRFWLKRPRGAWDMVKKGSIALDGISLTISRLLSQRLAVDIIPHTYENTNISTWGKGSRVNVETDMFGKYASSWLQAYGPS